MPVTDDEKSILAPALRRAAALLLHWQDGQPGVTFTAIFQEMITLGDATDTILALLLLQDRCIINHTTRNDLQNIAYIAALKEA